MEFIDTHTHLYLRDYLQSEPIKTGKKGHRTETEPEPTPTGCDDAVSRAIDAGVTRMIFPGTSLDELPPMKTLAARFPANIFMAAGLHPTELTDNPQAAIDAIAEELSTNHSQYCAIGEIGIDLYWEPEHREQQMQAFDRQCRLALEYNLPIIIHCREGLNETLEVLEGLPTIPNGVFHSFGGTEADIERIRRLGDFYFGINGIVTFKNSNLREILPTIGIDRILLETDAPWLAPTPMRGRRNESSYLPYIARHIAENMSIPLEQVADITTGSAHKLFAI